MNKIIAHFPDKKTEILTSSNYKIDQIHCGLEFKAGYHVYHIKRLNGDLHCYVDEWGKRKFPKIVSINLENLKDKQIHNLNLPWSMYKKDKKCVMNGKTWVMKSYKLIDQEKYYTTTACYLTSYSCEI